MPQPYRYAGAYQDPTGLDQMGARYYDPTLGRFTQPDPSSREKNAYLYAGGDPVNGSDPSGLLSLDTFENLGSGLAVTTILYEGFTGGSNAAEAATAGTIAYTGISGLCEAGAAAFSGPGAAAALPVCMTIGTAAGAYVADNYKNNLT